MNSGQWTVDCPFLRNLSCNNHLIYPQVRQATPGHLPAARRCRYKLHRLALPRKSMLQMSH